MIEKLPTPTAKSAEQYAINVLELAERIGISRKIAYDLVNSPGFYPAFRIGRKILINVDQLKEWMKEQSGKR